MLNSLGFPTSILPAARFLSVKYCSYSPSPSRAYCSLALICPYVWTTSILLVRGSFISFRAICDLSSPSSRFPMIYSIDVPIYAGFLYTNRAMFLNILHYSIFFYFSLFVFIYLACLVNYLFSFIYLFI